MYAISLVLLSAGPVADLIKLPSDVCQIEVRRFDLPIHWNEGQRRGVKQLRLFVSNDQGKSWKHDSDHETTTKNILFVAPEDGLYWFAMQFVMKDGTSDPADLKNLRPDVKVFVNTSGKPVLVQKSYSEMQRENEELRKKIKELEKKLAESDSGRKPK